MLDFVVFAQVVLKVHGGVKTECAVEPHPVEQPTVVLESLSPAKPSARMMHHNVNTVVDALK